MRRQVGKDCPSQNISATGLLILQDAVIQQIDGTVIVCADQWAPIFITLGNGFASLRKIYVSCKFIIGDARVNVIFQDSSPT